MLIFLNGEIVPEEQAKVSVLDRSFLYGDGLFETILIFEGKPFRWDQHLDRLQRGAAFLKIEIPFSSESLRGSAQALIRANPMRNGLLRLTLSRGIGPRGYSPKGADRPTLVMTVHPSSDSGVVVSDEYWKLITSSVRLPAGETLAQFKTCNKLAQVLARAEADAADADEALLLNTDGFVVEGASSNLFWVEGKTICTPPVASGILPGITRATILEICDSLSLKTREMNIRPAELPKAEGVFVSLSSRGVIAAESIDGVILPKIPLIAQVRDAYWEMVRVGTDWPDHG